MDKQLSSEVVLATMGHLPQDIAQHCNAAFYAWLLFSQKTAESLGVSRRNDAALCNTVR